MAGSVDAVRIFGKLIGAPPIDFMSATRGSGERRCLGAARARGLEDARLEVGPGTEVGTKTMPRIRGEDVARSGTAPMTVGGGACAEVTMQGLTKAVC